MINIRQLWDSLDIKQYPMLYAVELDAAAATSTDSDKIRIGDRDFWAHEILITAMDDAGVIMELNDFDIFKIQIKDSDGQEFFSEAVPLQMVAQYIKSFLHKGFLLRKQKDYVISITGTGFPGTSTVTYPIKIWVAMAGNHFPHNFNITE